MIYEIMYFGISIINLILILIIILVFLRGSFSQINFKKIIDLRVIAFGILMLKEVTHLWLNNEKSFHIIFLMELPETIFLLVFLYGLLKLEKLLSNQKFENKIKRKA